MQIIEISNICVTCARGGPVIDKVQQFVKRWNGTTARE